MNNMNIPKLKTGNVVVLRDKSLRIVLTECETNTYGKQEFCLIGEDTFNSGDGFDKILCNCCSDKYDIMEIHKATVDGNTYMMVINEETLLWRRTQEKKKFSKDELTVMRMINDKYKWLSRDSYRKLYVYEEEQLKYNAEWGSVGDGTRLDIFNNKFQEIKWEDMDQVCIDDYVERE